MTFRQPGRHEAIQAARQRQETPEWRTLYGVRAGIEGCLSQGVRVCGLRRSRYVGLTKTHLQHLATAAALNVVRLDAWLRGRPRATTRELASRSSYGRLSRPNEFANGILCYRTPNP